MSYTEEQIRAAWGILYDRNNCEDPTPDELIAELNRPAIEFEEGEIVAHPSGYAVVRGNTALTGIGGTVNLAICRKLTRSELSPEVRALRDGMERIANGDVGQGGYIPKYAQFALKVIRAFDEAHPDD